MDATYRSELRELNEANFARFDAKLEQRVAELRAEMTAGFAEIKSEIRQQIAGARAELIKWTFFFWLGTIGLVLLLLRFPGGSV